MGVRGIAYRGASSLSEGIGLKRVCDGEGDVRC